MPHKLLLDKYQPDKVEIIHISVKMDYKINYKPLTRQLLK